MNLAEALPQEIARVRELMEQYKEIGNAGLFGCRMMQKAITYAEEAILAGDVVNMIQAYNDLKSWEA